MTLVTVPPSHRPFRPCLPRRGGLLSLVAAEQQRERRARDLQTPSLSVIPPSFLGTAPQRACTPAGRGQTRFVSGDFSLQKVLHESSSPPLTAQDPLPSCWTTKLLLNEDLSQILRNFWVMSEVS